MQREYHAAFFLPTTHRLEPVEELLRGLFFSIEVTYNIFVRYHRERNRDEHRRAEARV